MVAGPGDQPVLDAGEEQKRLKDALEGLHREGLVKLRWVAAQKVIGWH